MAYGKSNEYSDLVDVRRFSADEINEINEINEFIPKHLYCTQGISFKSIVHYQVRAKRYGIVVRVFYFFSDLSFDLNEVTTWKRPKPRYPKVVAIME